jgi:hypothetical protein
MFTSSPALKSGDCGVCRVAASLASCEGNSVELLAMAFADNTYSSDHWNLESDLRREVKVEMRTKFWVARRLE